MVRSLSPVHCLTTYKEVCQRGDVAIEKMLVSRPNNSTDQRTSSISIADVLHRRLHHSRTRDQQHARTTARGRSGREKGSVVRSGPPDRSPVSRRDRPVRGRAVAVAGWLSRRPAWPHSVGALLVQPPLRRHSSPLPRALLCRTGRNLSARNVVILWVTDGLERHADARPCRPTTAP